MSEKPKEKNLVPMILKTFDLLEAFREHPQGLSYMELVEQNPKISKISIYRILCTLHKLRYLHKDENTNKFELGTKFIELGRITQGRLSVVRIAEPYMEELRDKWGEQVNLSTVEDDELISLRVLEGTHPLRVVQYTNRREALYSSASGKAILGHLSLEERDSILRRVSFKKLTPKTITTRADYEKELEKALDLGYAIDDEENLSGVRCLGAALRDQKGHPIAALSITGPTTRINQQVIPRMAQEVIDAANEISERFFGYTRSG